MTDHPTEHVDRVAKVLREHQGFQAMTAQSTWVCSRECGWRGDMNGGRQQWEAHVAEAVCAALDAATPPRLDADDVRDAVGDHYDHAPRLVTPRSWPMFPLWHDERLIDAFDWEGITRTLNDGLGVGSVGERDQP
jgi:hypothetical protein